MKSWITGCYFHSILEDAEVEVGKLENCAEGSSARRKLPEVSLAKKIKKKRKLKLYPQNRTRKSYQFKDKYPKGLRIRRSTYNLQSSKASVTLLQVPLVETNALK